MSIENFSWLLLDHNNDPIVAASPLPTITIRKVLDNTTWDWADSSFKSSNWGLRAANLDPIDFVHFPGVYDVNLDIGTLSGRFYAYVSYEGAGKQRIVQEFNVVDGVLRVDPLSGLSQQQSDHLLAIPENPLLATDTRVDEGISEQDKQDIATTTWNQII